MTALLEADGVSFAYGARPAIRDVSLTVNRGEIVGLAGVEENHRNVGIQVECAGDRLGAEPALRVEAVHCDHERRAALLEVVDRREAVG